MTGSSVTRIVARVIRRIALARRTTTASVATNSRSGVRSSYRPEAYREAGETVRPTEGRNDFRPNGGQPKRKFHARPRRPGGGPRRAHG